VGGVLAQGATQLGHLLDGQPAVLGDDRRGRVGELLGDLGDRAELVCIRHVLPPLLWSRAGRPGTTTDEKRPGAGRTGRHDRGPNRPSCAGRSGACGGVRSRVRTRRPAVFGWIGPYGTRPRGGVPNPGARQDEPKQTNGTADFSVAPAKAVAESSPVASRRW